ncbi:50S ribosomal protein L17 [Sphaeroforma arctica JP610]|uniref:50S ribosomal protein L17 n=1 Tax=Sphaeroforma arctica JP610 TaxID=667725 RepID=A0A0L0G8I5_9EUKA|nr:50S ribosomal protein L17 [Sphaeroforma arctica JP610]KNC84553.1 50S ribosomal protein L17 [Sphaeroforma arctica JP610]|eukprot:XP_014158455.1 50S ribosomal protein L17 [Sphaeroforma arctica JP610]
MKHGVKFSRLGRPSGHRRALLRNMVTSLVKFERIVTTKVKARELARAAEKIITTAKKTNGNANREANAYLLDNYALPKLFELAARYKYRDGGYTRILRLPNRTSDNAHMSVIEYVDNPFPPLREPKETRLAAIREKSQRKQNNMDKKRMLWEGPARVPRAKANSRGPVYATGEAVKKKPLISIEELGLD